MNSHSGKLTVTLFYLGSFLCYYLVTYCISLFPNFAELNRQGLVVPVLCLIEFAVIYPLYRFYCQRRLDIPMGHIALKQGLFFTLIFALFLVLETQVSVPEVWIAQQAQHGLGSKWILFLTAGLLAPVFEEILFRGFILQAFLLWAPKSRLAAMVLTSLIFALLHTQYTSWQTLLILTCFSLLLCWARLKSNSLALPIGIHTINNLIALLPLLCFG